MTEDADRWCAGLRVTRARALDAAEQERIRRARRSRLVAATGWLLAVPLAVAAAAAGLSVAPYRPVIETAAVVYFAVCTFVGIPLAFVMANDAFRRARLLTRQLREPQVLVCEGAAADLIAEGQALRRLRRQIAHRTEVVLEVLVPTGLVWTIDGAPAARWILVPRSRTATPPPQARMAARYVRPVDTPIGTLRLHQRLLSETECAELEGYLPRITRLRGLSMLALHALAVGHVVAFVRHPAGVPFMSALMVTAVLWCDVQIVRLFRARRRMQRDLRERFVVIYQPDPESTASEASIVELLPHTGAEWTTGGRPASWRRLYGATT